MAHGIEFGRPEDTRGALLTVPPGRSDGCRPPAVCKAQEIIPQGSMEEAASENMLAGVAFGRRAAFN